MSDSLMNNFKLCWSGVANSAAAVGVGARLSDAKSIKVVSVSCPTAEIIGISLNAAARTTFSSRRSNFV